MSYLVLTCNGQHSLVRFFVPSLCLFIILQPLNRPVISSDVKSRRAQSFTFAFCHYCSPGGCIFASPSGAFCLFLSPPDGQELVHDLRKASLKSWTSATIRQVARAPLYCSVGNQFNVLVASQPCQGYICYPDQAIAPSRTCFSSNVAQLSNWSFGSCKLSG